MYVVKEQQEQHDRYETVDSLSDGAMGSVILARDRLMDRFVAIKTANLNGITDPEELQRLRAALLSEAQVVQLLSHPNIVTVHDVIDNPEDSAPSLVKEYIQGSTLEAFLKGGNPLPVDFAQSVVIQVARGLEHAHTMGVLHGDIKPANILLSDDGEHAKIADFGIAKLMGGSSERDDKLFGTPRYVSPEQILGQSADHRSDLFSLGVVLYEMLTGQSPFAGQSSQEITLEIARGSADLSAVALRGVPEHLQAVLRKALERDPANRFQSAHQFVHALDDDSQPLPPSADTVTTQDLSALVVPDLPEDDPEEASPNPPPPLLETRSQQPDTNRSHHAVAREPLPWSRWALVAGLTALCTLLIFWAVIWYVAPATESDGRFSDDHRIAARVLPLLKEGQRQMLEGQPEVASRLFRRGQDMVPPTSDLFEMLHQAENRAIEQQLLQQRSEEIEALLSESRAALDSGRGQQALRLASQALSLDPENVETQALIDTASSVRSVRTPRASTTASAPKAKPSHDNVTKVVQSEPRAPVRAEPTGSTVVPQSPPVRGTQPEPASATRPADLRVDVFSYLSKGVLTVYADEEQVLLEPFKFVQKSGFMRRKKTAGRLETSVVLPSGPTEFRIYVSADGQETQTVNLDAELSGGQTHVLRLIIAENGSASAQLN